MFIQTVIITSETELNPWPQPGPKVSELNSVRSQSVGFISTEQIRDPDNKKNTIIVKWNSINDYYNFLTQNSTLSLEAGRERDNSYLQYNLTTSSHLSNQ